MGFLLERLGGVELMLRCFGALALGWKVNKDTEGLVRVRAAWDAVPGWTAGTRPARPRLGGAPGPRRRAEHRPLHAAVRSTPLLAGWRARRLDPAAGRAGRDAAPSALGRPRRRRPDLRGPGGPRGAPGSPRVAKAGRLEAARVRARPPPAAVSGLGRRARVRDVRPWTPRSSDRAPTRRASAASTAPLPAAAGARGSSAARCPRRTPTRRSARPSGSPSSPPTRSRRPPTPPRRSWSSWRWRARPRSPSSCRSPSPSSCCSRSSRSPTSRPSTPTRTAAGRTSWRATTSGSSRRRWRAGRSSWTTS